MSRRSPLGPRTVPLEVAKRPTCAIAIPSGIRSLVPVPPAKEGDMLRAVTFCPSQPQWLMYLSLAGRHGWPAAQRHCLPRRKFLVAAENILCLTLCLTRRFPNPVPSGTRVPHWALLDVTVRC
jgi:hypothetical protein